MKSQNKPKKREEKLPPFKSIRYRRSLATRVLNKLKDENPHPKCELYHESPFQLLISVVLSAQTTDKMVNKCMMPVYKKGFTPASVLDMGQTGLLEVIKSIGLAPTKSKNIIALTKIVVRDYGSKIPSTRSQLEALPGVGKKTASVILGEVFNEPTLAVDTHVYRVGRRLGLHQESSPDKAEKELLNIVREDFRPRAHHWFILLGRYTCKAQKPACNACPVAELCPSRETL